MTINELKAELVTHYQQSVNGYLDDAEQTESRIVKAFEEYEQLREKMFSIACIVPVVGKEDELIASWQIVEAVRNLSKERDQYKDLYEKELQGKQS